jgi:hypothetical protein
MTSALFSPIRIAELELPNRVVISPMCQYSARDGCMTDWHLTHLGSLANSGASLLVFEATAVERHGRISHGDVGLYDDDCEAAMARVIAHCRRIGTASSASRSPTPAARRPPNARGRVDGRSRTHRTPGRPSRRQPFRWRRTGTPRRR